MVLLLATVAAWAPAAYALPAVSVAATDPAATGCVSSEHQALPTSWCARQSGFDALDGRQQAKRDAFGAKPDPFAVLMRELGVDADEIVYSQSNRTSPLHRNGSVRATAKSPAILPEPTTWIMLLLGFGAIGAFVRRRFRRSEDRFTTRIRSIEAGENR